MRRIKYKQEHKKLKEENNNLKLQLEIMKIYKITPDTKQEIIEEYFAWCLKKDFNPDSLSAYTEYKQELEKRSKHE